MKKNGAYVILTAADATTKQPLTEFVAGAQSWSVDTHNNLNVYSCNFSSTSMPFPMATFSNGEWAGIKSSNSTT